MTCFEAGEEFRILEINSLTRFGRVDIYVTDHLGRQDSDAYDHHIKNSDDD